MIFLHTFAFAFYSLFLSLSIRGLTQRKLFSLSAKTKRGELGGGGSWGAACDYVFERNDTPSFYCK